MLKINKQILVISASLLLVGCGPNNAPKATLKILTGPNKTSYNCGNDFDKTGLTLEYTDDNGVTETITNFTLRGDKNLISTQHTVIASYNGLDVNVNIDVSDTIEGQITCVGDSLTAGHYWANEAYPVYIKDNFEDASKIMVSNCGINGASFKTFGQYNPAYNTTEQYQTSLTGDPIVLTILLGTNDATNWANEKDLYVQDYTDLVNTYRTTFGEELNIIMITSPRCIDNEFGIPGKVICDEVAPLQRQLAEDLDCELIDLNEEFQNLPDTDLFRDGVHFTVNAAQITAKLIAEKIQAIYEIE